MAKTIPAGPPGQEKFPGEPACRPDFRRCCSWGPLWPWGIWAAPHLGPGRFCPRGERPPPPPQSSGTSQPAESAVSLRPARRGPHTRAHPGAYSHAGTPTPPPIPDDGSDGYLSSGVYIWQNKAFELFYGSTDDRPRPTPRPSPATSSCCRGDHGVTTWWCPTTRSSACRSASETTWAAPPSGRTSSDEFRKLHPRAPQVIPRGHLRPPWTTTKTSTCTSTPDTHWAPLGAYWAYTTFCEAQIRPPRPSPTSPCPRWRTLPATCTWPPGESCLAENPRPHRPVRAWLRLHHRALLRRGVLYRAVGDVRPGRGHGVLHGAVGGQPPGARHQPRRRLRPEAAAGEGLLRQRHRPVSGGQLQRGPRGGLPLLPREAPRLLPGETASPTCCFFNNVMSANTYSQIETMNGLF